MKKIKRLLVLVLIICIAAAPLTACTEADIATENVKKDADNFKHTRRLTVINGITGDTLLVLTGRISINEVRSGRKQLEVLIKTGKNDFKMYYVGLADNVTYIVETLEAPKTNPYRYKLYFNPNAWLPEVEFPDHEDK